MFFWWRSTVLNPSNFQKDAELIYDEDELLRSEFLPSVLLPSESLLWCCIRWSQSWSMHRLWSGLCSFTVPVDLSPLGLSEDWAQLFFQKVTESVQRASDVWKSVRIEVTTRKMEFIVL
jgi:hypothetical protein